MEERFNTIELTEKDGVGSISIDNTKIKGISKYDIKRDTDIVTLTISISVPVKNFKTNLSQ